MNAINIPDIPFSFKEVWPTGSRYICDPPPTDTDNDTIVLVEDGVAFDSILMTNGWEFGGSFFEGDQWYSYKKLVNGVIENLIITEKHDLFARWKLATEVSKKLNLVDKRDRIIVFQLIVDGVEH